MFEHSIRVPRHYKIASIILKKVSTEGGSIKTLLYDDKFRHFRTNVLFALLTETIKHAAQIDKIFETSGILAAEPRLDPWLAKVLTAEILFGKKTLPGKSKPEQTILSYKDKFQIDTNENGDDVKIKDRWRPRYVRINTNLLTTSDAIRTFQDEGYKFIRCTSGSYDDYLQQIQNLTEYDFTQDYHIKTMFVFTSGTKLHDHELYHENKIILQDKATAMAVHLLAPPQGSVVLDMCAAPGMKTTQLAAYIKNQGKIYAVERNDVRYETLCDFVKRTESKCVEALNKDAFELKRGQYDDVEYILLDPSCSGSGMSFSVHNYVEDTRLAKLTSLQEKFLKHAMNAFPNAKRIVYSTCSVFPEENERVVTNVVTASRAKWRVQDVKEILRGQWNNFGSGMYGTMGARCLYAKPESDFTTGFFLAVLDRDQNDMEKCKKRVSENKKNNNDNKNENNGATSEIEDCNNHQIKHKEKKNKKIKMLNETIAEKKTDDSKYDNRGIKQKKKDREISNETVVEPEEIKNKEENASKNECNEETSELTKKKENNNTKLQEDMNIKLSLPVSDEINVILDNKKKKKKREKIIETPDDHLDVDMNEKGYLNESINMKKKKKKESTDKYENLANVAEKCTIKKKQKKNNTKVNIESMVLDISSEESSNATYLLQKNKKKSKTKNNIQCEVLDISPENNIDSINVPLKRKNKLITNDNTQYEVLDITSENNVDSINVPHKKKKKSKRIDNTQTEAQDISSDNNVDAMIVPYKKKKKSKGIDNTQNEVLDISSYNKEDSMNVPHKKKKNKIIDNTQNEVLEIGSENNVHYMNGSHKKKKKSKRIDNTQNEVLDISSDNEVDSINVPHKKQKKSKTINSTQNVVLEIGSENDVESMEVLRKKKKKFKM